MVDIKYPTGTKDGLLKPFADDPPMYSRTGTYTNFTSTNSRNIVWGGSSSANTDYEDNHILIHHIRIINRDDDDGEAFIYFYHNNDATSANTNPKPAKNLLFYLCLTDVDKDIASSVLNIQFPIPLVIKNGCRIAASKSNAIIADVCYTVLNNSNTLDWYTNLQYRYLTGASKSTSGSTSVHPNFGTAGSVDTFSTAADHITATYTDVALTGGTGYGAEATVVVNSTGASGPPQLGAVASVTITERGAGYTINDTLTIDNATIGGVANATCDVSGLYFITTDVELWGGYAINSTTDSGEYMRAQVRNGAGSTRASMGLNMNQHAALDQSAALSNTDDGVVWYPYPVHLKSGMYIYNDDSDIRSAWFYRPVKQSGATYDQYGD
jgi:hypothetical protein